MLSNNYCMACKVLLQIAATAMEYFNINNNIKIILNKSLKKGVSWIDLILIVHIPY